MPYTPKSVTKLVQDKPLGPSPSLAPNFTLHRTKSGSVDSIPAGIPVLPSAGMNMTGFLRAVIQIVPTAGTTAAADATVYFWSEKAGKFVVSSLAKTAPAVNTPYQFSVEVNGGIIWVALGGTIGAADGVAVMIAGEELDRDR